LCAYPGAQIDRHWRCQGHQCCGGSHSRYGGQESGCPLGTRWRHPNLAVGLACRSHHIHLEHGPTKWQGLDGYPLMGSARIGGASCKDPDPPGYGKALEVWEGARGQQGPSQKQREGPVQCGLPVSSAWQKLERGRETQNAGKSQHSS